MSIFRRRHKRTASLNLGSATASKNVSASISHSTGDGSDMTPVTTLEPQQGGRRQNWGRRLRRPLSIIGTSSLGASGDFSVDSILEESLSKTDHVTPECIQRPRAVSTYIPAVTHNAEDSDEDEDDDYLHGIDHSISKWISINEHPPQTTTTNNYTTDTTPCIEKGSIHTATTASTEEEDDEYPVQTHDDTLFLNNRGIVWVGGLDRPEKTLPAPIYEHRLVFDDEDDDQPFSNRIRSIWVN